MSWERVAPDAVRLRKRGFRAGYPLCLPLVGAVGNATRTARRPHDDTSAFPPLFAIAKRIRTNSIIYADLAIATRRASTPSTINITLGSWALAEVSYRAFESRFLALKARFAQ